MDDKFVVFCSEKAGSAERRTRTLADHLKHLESTMDRISLAAALKDEDGQLSGSIMIVGASNAEYARRFVERDLTDLARHLVVLQEITLSDNTLA